MSTFIKYAKDKFGLAQEYYIYTYIRGLNGFSK